MKQIKNMTWNIIADAGKNRGKSTLTIRTF